jgi:pimeloyl-ACP methyl ester carboxylesterase
MPREGGEAISRLAPGAALRVIEGAGHLPQQERPEELAKILTELIFG